MDNPERPCDPAERPKANPCAPEPPEEECECKTPGVRETPKKPQRPKGRREDCCQQLIDILGRVPGLKLPEPRKPKQRPARKAQDLCAAIGIADTVLPALAVLWGRHRANEAGRNEFEKKVKAVFDQLTPKSQKALDLAFDGYAKLRQSGKAECLFNDCLADAAKQGPVERAWFAEEAVREGLKFVSQVVFAGSGGEMGPGQVRLWDNVVYHGPNGSKATVFQGPWPWLTAILPNPSSYQEFGNLRSFRPVPNKKEPDKSSHIWQSYQYSQTCKYTPGYWGGIQVECSREHPPPPPPPPPPGQFLADPPPTCPGGPDYTHANDCVRIPVLLPGGAIKLKGFNFITPTVKVIFRHTTDPSVVTDKGTPPVLEGVVWGDRETPLKDEDGHFIVDERVHDWVDVTIPSKHPNPTHQGAPLPAGIYSITVVVANVTNANYDGSVPKELATNPLLVRIEPDPNIKFNMWSERGRCNRETAGLGDDEIWWDAFTGHLVPNSVPLGPTGAAGVTLDVARKSFPRDPWKDMDDGESAGAYNQNIWGPAAFELYGVTVVSVLGYEVDDEATARKQIEDFWEAFGVGMMSILEIFIAGEGVILGVAEVALKAGVKVIFSHVIIAMIAVAFYTFIAVLFWAAWARADLIALDLFTLDALSAWEKTDPEKPLPAEDRLQVGDVAVVHRPLPKDHKKGDAAAAWVAEHQYDTPEDGEDASYTLEFRLARS
ncbi:MAG TPA: hypothetical protein VGG03_15150 [Thermoanaerobaculia bacterium]|jgi:hypothetical protein